MGSLMERCVAGQWKLERVCTPGRECRDGACPVPCGDGICALDESCTRVIVDHYLVGDGSKGGARTKRRGLPAMLENQGLADWTRIEVLHATAAVFQRVLGPGRVGVSRAREWPLRFAKRGSPWLSRPI